jgi:hypothetical protein
MDAWDAYVRAVRFKSQNRLDPGRSFLFLDERDGISNRVREGEVFVSPVGQTPQKVPAGLIHDWVGATFIPDVTLDEVLHTVRDYDHYKLFYGPAVIDSKTLVSNDSKDRFSMLLANKSIVSKAALDSDYESSYVRVDSHRWYSISETTRVQEIQGYGSTEERMLPENEGAGLIWRLLSITRFEERDGGVYIELEAIALSRDIPPTLRWMVTPIVRRVSKNALVTSLQQTGTAVHSRSSMASRMTKSEHSPEPSTGAIPVVNTFRLFH